MKTLERHALQVPRDLSLIGIDNTPEADIHGLTSVRLNFGEIGEHAVTAWLALHSGQDEHGQGHVVPVQMVNRRSVGPAPS